MGRGQKKAIGKNSQTRGVQFWLLWAQEENCAAKQKKKRVFLMQIVK